MASRLADQLAVERLVSQTLSSARASRVRHL
jgi:hypothetical protein